MWARAYLEQARSDWRAHKVVAGDACDACHGLHYLQMTTEKLGKAVLLKSGAPPETVQKTHRAFVRFLRVAARNPSLRQALKMNAAQLQLYVRGILPIADKIERLAPALSRNGPNAEYPWETGRLEVVVPATYRFPVLGDLRGPRGRKLLRLVSAILDDFDVFF